MGKTSFNVERNNILRLITTKINGQINDLQQKNWDARRAVEERKPTAKALQIFKESQKDHKAYTRALAAEKKRYESVLKAYAKVEAAREKAVKKALKKEGFIIASNYASRHLPTLFEIGANVEKRQEAVSKPIQAKITKLNKLRDEAIEKVTLSGSPEELRAIFAEVSAKL